MKNVGEGHHTCGIILRCCLFYLFLTSLCSPTNVLTVNLSSMSSKRWGKTFWESTISLRWTHEIESTARLCTCLSPREGYYKFPCWMIDGGILAISVHHCNSRIHPHPLPVSTAYRPLPINLRSKISNFARFFSETGIKSDCWTKFCHWWTTVLSSPSLKHHSVEKFECKQQLNNTPVKLTRQVGHLLTGWAHVAHMAVCPHGWKEISHGPSQRKQLGPVTESTSLSSDLSESPPDTETSGGVASLPLGVVLFTGIFTNSLLVPAFVCKL